MRVVRGRALRGHSEDREECVFCSNADDAFDGALSPKPGDKTRILGAELSALVVPLSDDVGLRQARLRLMKRLELLILQLGDISEIVATE